jgi:hypothetical protein
MCNFFESRLWVIYKNKQTLYTFLQFNLEWWKRATLMGDYKRAFAYISTQFIKSQFSQSENHSSYKTVQFLALENETFFNWNEKFRELITCTSTFSDDV